MIRNYIIIALRNLWRNKLITSINLVGMGIGFGIFLSLFTWIRWDLSFDKFHEDIDQMYLLNVRINLNNSEYTSQRTGGIYARLLKEEFPQVLSTCRISEPFEFELGIVAAGSSAGESEDSPMRYINEKQVLAVDSSFFDFFSFKLIKGNRDLIFTEKDHLVLTETLANKLFGDRDPMNQVVRIGEGGYFRVMGVAEDPPVVSTFQFQALLGFDILAEMGYPLDGYGGTIYHNNVKLAPGTDVMALSQAINEHVEANFETDLESTYFLDSLKRLHLYGETKGVIGLMMNLIMSFVILFIACINFINLTTAYASERIREIAIRKSAGAGKRQLVVQFLSETYLLLLLAFYLGLFLAEQLVPLMSRSFGFQLETEFNSFSVWAQILSIYLLTGLLAGLYPAFKIAGFRPHIFLSGKNGNISKQFHGGRRFRRILIVVQFTFSIILIIVSIFTIRQYNYLTEADLGFNREDVLYIRTKGEAWTNYHLIKRDLEALHFIEGVGSGSEIPVMIDRGDIDWGDRDGEHNQIARILVTDPGYLTTLEIDLLEGEYFSEEKDTLNYEYVVVNQSLVELMGWENPVGRKFYLWGRDFHILGVTGNIHFFPFNMEVLGGNEALIYVYEEVREYIFVRVRPDASSEELAGIQAIFQKHNPGYEFDHDFIKNYKYQMLEGSEGINFVFKLFSFTAIFIAVMGLIGLSLFNSNRRTKEVGIRKVNGAHTGVIMKLLLSEFIKLVTLSNLIALPLAYLILWKLLQFFSYSIDLKIGVFIIVFILALIFSMLTVCYHAYKTARSNPVNSLRYE